MGNPKKVESMAEKAPVRDKNGKDEVEVLRGGFGIELDDAIEGLEGLFGQMGIAINADKRGKEGWGGGVAMAFEVRENIVHEREMAGSSEFEDESIKSGVRMAEIGLTRG